MKLKSVFITTKKGTEVEFRSASADDALLEIDYLKRVCGETSFLLSEPGELSFTEESERERLTAFEKSSDSLIVNAYVDGEFAGNGSFQRVSGAKRMSHRATMGIALFQKYCGLGIGEAMICLMSDKARECGYEIMELEVFASNTVARRLYEKLGFTESGRAKNAVKYSNGRYDDEIKMQKFLNS